jgi:signal transduction histidine kinase
LAKQRSIQLKRTLVRGLTAFSILLTSGIVLIFISSTHRDALHREIIELTANIESRLIESTIQINDLLTKEAVVDLNVFKVDAPALRILLQQLNSRLQENMLDPSSDLHDDFEAMYAHLTAALDNLESLMQKSRSGSGQVPGEEIRSATNRLYFSFRAYETKLPGLLLEDNRRSTYLILAIVFINLLFLFIAGYVILRLSNRLVRADREMVRKAIDVETRERERIAADLHDGLGSLLSGLLIHIQALEKQHAGDAKLKEQLRQLNDLSYGAIHSIEEVIHNLHPSSLTRYGLVDSVSRLIRRINILGRTQFRIRVAEADVPFPKSTELFLFRICNELINNALKHSKATMANFDFYTEKNTFHLVYSDDGVGFASDELSLEDEKGGLHNIVRRVESMDGKCRILSKPDQGVEIEIVLDIK